jgi:hypothetical protein
MEWCDIVGPIYWFIMTFFAAWKMFDVEDELTLGNLFLALLVGWAVMPIYMATRAGDYVLIRRNRDATS